MILRRVIEHVKKQEWTAVFIDFLIVVVGVFIGIQVSNWNEGRQDRETETLYLVRLAQELSDMEPKAEAAFAEVSELNELIAEVRDYFATGVGGESLNSAHCSAIARSHIFDGVIFYPPTIKELISTGRIVLVRDPDLRTAILAFDQTNEEISQLREDIQIDRLTLARTHPDLVNNGILNWEDSICDYDAMVVNQSFLNDFTDNSRRYMAYVNDVQGRQSELIKSLGAKVAARRGETFEPSPEQSGSENTDKEESR
ncbi:MAG: hypothetical protein AB7F91_06165 [Parvularculaceae bacterium]